MLSLLPLSNHLFSLWGQQVACFSRFQEALDVHVFDRSIVERFIDSRARQSLVATIHKPAWGGEESRCFARVFGVERRGRDALWWSDAVSIPATSNRCMAHTGAPRFCSSLLWHLRAWAIASGGFDRMGFSLQGDLLKQEGVVDDLSSFVFWPAEVHLKAEWMHVLDIAPGGLPAPVDWVHICRLLLDNGGGLERIRELRNQMYQARVAAGVIWNSYLQKWELTKSQHIRFLGGDREQKRQVMSQVRHLPIAS